MTAIERKLDIVNEALMQMRAEDLQESDFSASAESTIGRLAFRVFNDAIHNVLLRAPWVSLGRVVDELEATASSDPQRYPFAYVLPLTFVRLVGPPRYFGAALPGDAIDIFRIVQKTIDGTSRRVFETKISSPGIVYVHADLEDADWYDSVPSEIRLAFVNSVGSRMAFAVTQDERTAGTFFQFYVMSLRQAMTINNEYKWDGRDQLPTLLRARL